MKRTLLVLLIIILAKTTCFSLSTSVPIEKDSIVWLKASDLKYANLIFIEHDKLLKENKLLHTQIKNYIDLNNQLNQIDSLRVIKIDNLNKDINNLNKEVKKKNKVIRYWQIGGITVSVGLALFLILK